MKVKRNPVARTELVQQVQRDGLDHRRNRVRAGQQHGDDREDDDRVAPVLRQELRRHDAQARERQDRDGQLEDEARRRHRQDGELVVVARLQQDVELVGVEVLEEAHGRRQHDEVAERHADDEEDRDHRHQRERDPALRRSERRQDERVQLVEDQRHADQQREVEGNRERGAEWLPRAERDGLGALGALELCHVAALAGELALDDGPLGGLEARLQRLEQSGVRCLRVTDRLVDDVDLPEDPLPLAGAFLGRHLQRMVDHP